MTLADALNQQGLQFLTTGDLPHAIAFFQAAIREADLADAHTNLGVAYFMHHQFEEAAVSLHRSLMLRPDHAHTLLNLGYSLWRLDNLLGAKMAFLRAIEIDDLALAHIALGSVYWEFGNNDAAIKHCEAGLADDPTNLLGWDTLREVYHYGGSEADALAMCDKMIALAPDHVTHPYKKAMVMLTHGNPAGWALHECRYTTSNDRFSQSAREKPEWFSRLFEKRWDGRPTGHLLVATEQGYGDVIHFLRYVPLAAERCTTLTLMMPPSLCRIVRQSFDQPHIKVVTDPPDQFDHYCLMMSLAHLLDGIDTVPQPPYLTAARDKYNDVRNLAGIKVGLAWTGSKEHPEDRWRSIPFDLIMRLVSLPARFISLQFPAKINSGCPIMTVPCSPTKYADGFMAVDWTETAALINALDLVICVDTAVAHMAGALGKPVWLMNRYNTDWRWQLHRSDTPWYPTMRIFRQPTLGDWDSVIQMVYRTFIAEFVNSR